MKYLVGIDLGGTNIKAGLLSENKIIAETSIPTQVALGPQNIIATMAETVSHLIYNAGLSYSDVAGLGIACPGTVIPDTGIVAYANNLRWKNVPLCQELTRLTKLPAYGGNDANIAALGEAVAGSAQKASSAVIVTLGTGVGSGLVLRGSIWTGHNCIASEFGHMVIRQNGRLCTCGRQGCFETYASATGLFVTVREFMSQYPNSTLHDLVAREGLHGYTPFIAADNGDECAQIIVSHYINDLACGITNIINGLQPEVISLGGGIARQGERLLEPLREVVYQQVYGGKDMASTRIVTCTLGYQAGIIGAATLAAQKLGINVSV